jgi:hypothetical protein
MRRSSRAKSRRETPSTCLSRYAVVRVAWAAVVLLSTFAASSTADNWRPPEVIVEAPAGDAGDGLWVRVMLDNSTPGCGVTVVSRRFAGVSDETRPETLLDFEIVDEKGDKVSRAHRGGISRPPYVVGDVTALDCGSLMGWYVVIGKPEWEYVLPPGKYRLRARVENRVRAYFDRHPAQLASLTRAVGLDRTDLSSALRDFSVVSKEITIEVGPKH